MGKKKTLIWILVLVLLIGGAFAMYTFLGENLESDRLATNPPETTAETQDKILAPDFTVYDAEGKAYKLSDFRGKPVVINFWASWCGPCKSEMPDFETLYKKYEGKVHFLMVNLTDGVQETQKSAAAYITQQGFTFPVYYDTELSAATSYSVWSIPATYFINAQGYGVTWGSGALNLATLERGISMILDNAG